MNNPFRGKPLPDLHALHPWIKAGLERFIEAGNCEQTITYRRLLKQLEEQIQRAERIQP